MKIVVNRCYGGFSLSQACANALGTSRYPDEEIRTDERLIRMVEEDPVAASGLCAKLDVAEIPDDATDWMLHDYDGLEDILYVQNGKLHWA